MEKKDSPPGTSKKSYNTPVLQVYGDLRTITKAITSNVTAADDGNNNPNHFKTHA